MSDATVAPYGSWKSPISSDLIATRTLGTGNPTSGLRMVTLDGDDVCWLQIRPHEEGRYVITRRTLDGKVSDVTPVPFNVRTRVHEYGGGDFLVSDRTVYFSNFVDQRLYRQEPEGVPTPMTPEDDFRYADGVLDRLRSRLICVREDHTVSGQDAINSLVSIDLERPDAGRVIVSGNDFYSSPRVSPDGSRLAWLTWNHPNMPWDGTELWVGELEADGSLGRAELVCGGEDESIFQPEWSPDGVLHFVSDRTGWWNLYRRLERGIEPLCEMEADFGYPQWAFGLSLYGFESPHRIICAYADQGVWRLASLDTSSGLLEPVETPYSEFWAVRALPGRAVFAAGSPSEPPSVVELDVTTGQLEVLHRSSDVVIEEGYLSYPRAIEFPTEHGLTAHALYYPPQNRQYVAPAGERPPLIVLSHGGNTSSTWTTRRLEVQYWTSRGIGVLDVNYGGSIGYGRAYRERLKGQWGVVDIDDCVNGAFHLVKGGEVDGGRLAIRGGSAGGYTTLCALTFRDVFSAGASYYGVSDVEALAKETHKFESRYLDSLIGPYPEQRELYQERSPIHFAERLSCPVIFFQGLEDQVVPPSQAELMVNALRAKGVPVAYIAFEGEQHGFRRAETIKRALDAELYFYSRIFGFDLAEPVEPVSIDNL
jgi:dipeptidyl aminopeptidase/acylaminoacyl peptidase